MLTRRFIAAGIAALVVLASHGMHGTLAQTPQQQAPAGGRAGVPPPPDKTKPHKLEITTGTRARYKVTEQLAGISFPSDAVGTRTLSSIAVQASM